MLIFFVKPGAKPSLSSGQLWWQGLGLSGKNKCHKGAKTL